MDKFASKRWAFRPPTRHYKQSWRLAVRFIGSCGFLRLDFQLLAVRLSTSCVSKVLAGKPQKHDIFTSCGGLRVLAAQEVLAALLARALFLGCTVLFIQSQATSELYNLLVQSDNLDHLLPCPNGKVIRLGRSDRLSFLPWHWGSFSSLWKIYCNHIRLTNWLKSARSWCLIRFSFVTGVQMNLRPRDSRIICSSVSCFWCTVCMTQWRYKSTFCLWFFSTLFLCAALLSLQFAFPFPLTSKEPDKTPW